MTKREFKYLRGIKNKIYKGIDASGLVYYYKEYSTNNNLYPSTFKQIKIR